MVKVNQEGVDTNCFQIAPIKEGVKQNDHSEMCQWHGRGNKIFFPNICNIFANLGNWVWAEQ